MNLKRVYIGVDLGAGSGRVLAAEYLNGRIELCELHRFENRPIQLRNGIHWNLAELFGDILEGLKLAAERYGDQVISIGIDSWGVDYGLLDAEGELIEPPFQYRDSRTEGMMDLAFSQVSKSEIYEATGLQFMFFNTLYQLLAAQQTEPEKLYRAEDLLFFPDLIGYLLTGIKGQERTVVSTSQLYNPRTGDWAEGLIEKFGFPRKLFKPIREPGSILGELKKEIRERTGLGNVKVVLVGGHDTASAVAAVPSTCETPAYLSTGTWSLLGLELEGPMIDEQSLASEFTNELGVNGRIRFLRNICGLWLIQECRRQWLKEGEDVSYASMDDLVMEAEPFRSLINPDDPVFASGGHMVERIQDFCRAHSQPIPKTKGEIIRCIYESLSLRYSDVWERLVRYTKKPPERLHVVGGGCQDKLLNQFAANSIGIKVQAGPVEATGFGNILVQMLSDNTIETLDEGRRIVQDSTVMEIFEPQDQDLWRLEKERFATLLE